MYPTMDVSSLPLASKVNYADTDEVCGYQMLLCKIFESAGGFKRPMVTNRVIKSVQTEGLIWLKKVRSRIDNILDSTIPSSAEGEMSLKDIPPLLGSYDFFYRVCHGTIPTDYLRTVSLKTADRYAKGDKTISQTAVALLLRREADIDARAIQQRYLDFSGMVMESWVDDLEIYGRLRRMDRHEAYEVLRYLLTHNLYAFMTDTASKMKWVKSYSKTDGQIDSLDTPTLRSYIGFEQAAAPLTGKPLEEQDRRHSRLSSMLARRPDLHPFIKESIAWKGE